MSIQGWNILLNAIIGVLIVAYGIWIRNVFQHQLKSKDATIEQLGAAIKSNEAEIARLRGETAPAIAVNYKHIKEYAEKVAEENNLLHERLIAMKPPLTVDSVQIRYIREFAAGFNAASIIFEGGLIELASNVRERNSVTAEELLIAITNISKKLSTESNKILLSLDTVQKLPPS